MRTLMIALLLGTSAVAQAAPADDLKKVIDDHWALMMRENPIQATTLGVRDYDDKIGDISLDAIQGAVVRASSTVKDIRWFEVVNTRGHVEGGKVAHYQVTVRLGFTLRD